MKKDEKNSDENWLFMILTVVTILIGIIIAIPIIYSVGRHIDTTLHMKTDATLNITENECTQPSKEIVKSIYYFNNSEPFPYKLFYHIYRPNVIAKTINLIFGFQHDNNTWSLDKISVIDLTTGENIIKGGDFEENYLKKYYSVCVLSNTRNSTSDILFDIPYQGDFYYNDKTVGGMSYLIQKLTITGGRYYNITYYLENRGYSINAFHLLVSY